MRGVAGAALAVLLCAGAAACTPPTNDADPGDASLPAADLSNVDVDTPELESLKRKAGIADCPRTDSEVQPVDDGLPELTLPCLGGGREVNLAALRGEPTVINVWASWCGPCRDELPLIARLHDTGKVRVLGIDSEDPQPRTALELAADNGVTYPSVADPAGESKEPLRIVGVPQTIFVRADGSVAGTKRGWYTAYADLASDAREYLGVDL